MNISPMPSIVRQPSSYIAQDKKLIFTYPILIDESINKYNILIRDFFSISFTGEIKIANILQVISTTFENPIKNNSRTPAELLLSTQPTMHNYNNNNNAYHFNKINERYQLGKFIQDQLKIIQKYIKTNHRYNKLRPAISTITIPGDPIINIPIIIGNQPYFTHTSTLYWILMFAIGFHLTLDSSSNFTRIQRYMRSFNPEQYYELIFTDEGRQRILQSSNIRHTGTSNNALNNFSRVLDAVFDDVNKTLTFFSIVLNANRWDRFNGIITSRTALSTTIERVSPQYYGNLDSASAIYNSFVSNHVNNIISNYITLFEPQVAAVTSLNDALFKYLTSLDFHDIGRIVIDNVQASARSAGNSDTNSLIRLSTMCKELTKYNAELLISQLRRINLPPSYETLQQVVDFHNTFEHVSQGLLTIANSIIKNLNVIITGDNLNRRFEDIYNEIKRKFHDYYFTDTSVGKILEDTTINNHIHWAAVNGRKIATVDDMNTLRQIADEAATSLTNITFFFYIYSFISFLCKSIDVISLDLETVKRDATDWPNYCLAIPIDMLTGLYAVSHIQNFNNIINDEDALSSLRERYVNWSINETQINRIIDFMSVRLQIPNFIVVDEKNNMMYYRFMFMEKTEKIRLQTVDTYIKSQYDILLVD